MLIVASSDQQAGGEARALADRFYSQALFLRSGASSNVRSCNSGLKGAEAEGVMGRRTPGTPPLRAGPGRKSYPGAPQ